MKHTVFEHGFMADANRAFGREYLLTSGAGAYSASTIGGCNTRKYHGLLVAEQPAIDDNDHVLVSGIDEHITYKESTYPLATHVYPGVLHPEGYKYIDRFEVYPAPRWTFRLDDCVLVKEMIMADNEPAVMIRYTVEEAGEKIQMDLCPFLAFRNVNQLKKAAFAPDKKIQAAANGIQAKMSDGYDDVYIQLSQKSEFITAPDWYYNIEYPVEQSRGYDYAEDLYVPGHFSVPLKKGDKLVIYAGLKESNPKTLATRFTTTLKKKTIPENEVEELEYAAKQFVVKTEAGLKIKAGYYWFGSWGRDTFISLPGLLLSTGQTKEFKEVMKSALADFKNGLFPNVGRGDKAVYNSVDASLWFIWAIQQYAIRTDSFKKIWGEYGSYLTEILERYSKGTLYAIKMDTDGLISAGHEGTALTWMDAVVQGTPVTPRRGKAVEINALWYNAVCFCIDVATLAGADEFVKEWQDRPGQIRGSFMATFSDKEKAWLADCVNEGHTDWSIRPNQVFALSLPYSPVPDYERKAILNTIKEELLTPRGLRTLSPNDKNYKGSCEGNQDERDMAYHQGTVWPWLSGHFAQACLNEYGIEGIGEVESICNNVKEMTGDACLGSVPEIYNGDYPHKPAGAVAQAWSVAELLRTERLLTSYQKSGAEYQTERI